MLCWPAIHWLLWPGYMSTYDGIYHLTRMIEVDALARQGIWYPRWFPDFGLGHGYPIFNFFPPCGYLLTELAALPLGDIPLAIQVSMAASMVISGWGFYLLARELCAGRLAATAAGAFYVYFPYHVQDVYTRGGMPELWAMAWLPWLAWSQLRATRQASAPWIATAGVLGAIEVGTHNILAVFMLPLSLAVSLAYARWKRRAVTAACACSGLGLLLSAGYWLPAVVEAPLTHVKQLAGDWLPYHTYELNQLVDPLVFAPYGDQIYKMTALEAGLVGGLLALMLVRAGWTRDRLPLLALAGLTLITVFGLTRWSAPLWMGLPLLGYIQFPWRLLILVGFLAGIMLAVAGSWRRWAWPVVALVAGVTAWTTLAHVPDNRFATTPPLDARSLETQEYGSAMDGVAIESEYQPLTSDQDLVKPGQGKRLPDDESALAPVIVQSMATLPTGMRLDVNAERDSRVRLQALYFPGWAARLDGQTWPLRPATRAGYVEAEVPAGSHRLEVNYDGTPLEGLAGAISGLALLGTGVWLAQGAWRAGRARRRQPLSAALIDRGAMAAGFIALAGGLVAAAIWPRQAAEWRPASWRAEGQTLVSSSAPRATERGVEVDLAWLYTAPREASFDFVLRDGSGREALRVPASQAATQRYEYLAVNELLTRHYSMSGAPAGTFSLRLEGAESADLGTVTVAMPQAPAHHLGVVFGGSAELDGYSLQGVRLRPGLETQDTVTRADAAIYPGDFVLASLLWRSLRGIDQNYVAFVHLIDGQGKAWAIHDNQPNATLQATSSWVPGQTIPDRYLLRMPEDAPAGVYRLEVGFYHVHETGFEYLTVPNGGNAAIFGSLKVRPRVPVPAATAIANWAEPIALEGWRAAQADGQVAVTFDWRAGGAISRDYTLFVHLSDAEGKVVAQADAPPQGGLFPTSVWDGGDRIEDRHTLQAPPPGRYRLSIGWYRPDNGERLRLSNGQDELQLDQIAVS